MKPLFYLSVLAIFAVILPSHADDPKPRLSISLEGRATRLGVTRESDGVPLNPGIYDSGDDQAILNDIMTDSPCAGKLAGALSQMKVQPEHRAICKGGGFRYHLKIHVNPYTTGLEPLSMPQGIVVTSTEVIGECQIDKRGTWFSTPTFEPMFIERIPEPKFCDLKQSDSETALKKAFEHAYKNGSIEALRKKAMRAQEEEQQRKNKILDGLGKTGQSNPGEEDVTGSRDYKKIIPTTPRSPSNRENSGRKAEDAT